MNDMFSGNKPNFKKFKTKSSAGKYAAKVYRDYGFDAGIYRIKNKKSKKVSYGVLKPKSAGLMRL